MQTHTNMLIYIKNCLATNKMPKSCPCQELSFAEWEALTLLFSQRQKCGIEELYAIHNGAIQKPFKICPHFHLEMISKRLPFHIWKNIPGCFLEVFMVTLWISRNATQPYDLWPLTPAERGQNGSLKLTFTDVLKCVQG